MKYNLLGRTGLHVSEICLGTMTFGGQGQLWSQIGKLRGDDVAALVKRAFAAGVNFIDTADVYSFGLSEKLTGETIRKLGLPRDELVLATKVTGVMSEKPNDRGQSRYHIMNAIDASLKRLGVDHVDLYQLHGFDPLTPMEEALSALNDIVRAGKARYIGVSNYAAWQIMKARAISEHNGWAKFESVQAYYMIAGRDLEREVIPVVQDQGMGVMVWSPLAGGILSGKFTRDGKAPKGTRRATFDFPPIDKARAFDCIDALRLIADKRKVSVAQVALAWLLHQKPVTSIIIGAKTVAQLDDNLASVKLKLTDEELAKLDAVSRLPAEYPGWMIERQSQYRANHPAEK